MKILLVMILSVMASSAHAQFPEVHWSAAKVSEYVSGKYERADTLYLPDKNAEGKSLHHIRSIIYTPYVAAGASGMLAVAFNRASISTTVVWIRASFEDNNLSDVGDHTRAQTDMFLHHMNSDGTVAQLSELADSLTVRYGKPKKSDFESLIEYEWKKKGVTLYLREGKLNFSAH